MVGLMIFHRTNLWSVVSSRCDFFLIQFVVGDKKLNWHLELNSFPPRRQTQLIARQYHIHEHEFVLPLDF